MVTPEVLEELSSLKNALFGGSVDAAAVDKCKLEPGSSWVTMCMLCLIVSKVLVSHIHGLWIVCELISSHTSQEMGVCLP